jgi:hypothetical protein
VNCRLKDSDPIFFITPSGTVSGANVTIVISVSTTAGTDTVTMTGTAKGTNLAGIYADSLSDSGVWTASTVLRPFGPPPSVVDYSGTFNSTANPLLIQPTIFIELGQGTSSDLTGKATITNSPCISSLSLSGQAIGDAFSASDATSKANLIAVPASPGSDNLNFSYKFDSIAPSCPGDFGRGLITINSSPWDY